MSNPFEDMTNEQLKEACKDFDLTVKAKNPAKPNKTEYLEALNEFKASQDKINGIEDVEDVVKEEPKATKGLKGTPKVQTKAQLLKLDLMRKERVIVRDMQESQTKDEMIPVSWGNRLGRKQEWIDLSGNPAYVRKGALDNLRDVDMVVHSTDASGKDQMIKKKRFVITSVEGLSSVEIEQLANQQRMRNSKIA